MSGRLQSVTSRLLRSSTASGSRAELKGSVGVATSGFAPRNRITARPTRESFIPLSLAFSESSAVRERLRETVRRAGSELSATEPI